jgi:hypothetical protein
MKKNRKKSLAETNRALAREWHPTKNTPLTPRDVTAGSSKKVWWKCKKDHEWKATVSNRTLGKGCPYCAGRRVSQDNCLQTANPRISKEWHPTKNGQMKPKDVTANSGRTIWWRCGKGHAWQTAVYHRNKGSGCPYCAGQRATRNNSLRAVNPGLAREWHATRNNPLTTVEVKAGSNKKVWWICGKGHAWKTSVAHRQNGQGCPYCAGRKACRENCLQTINPGVAKEWHPTRNAPLTPRDVTYGSEKKVWWKCGKGHEWVNSILHRNRGDGCPYCSGRRPTLENSLETRAPWLAREWHSRKNGHWTPKDIAPFSTRLIWWQCKKGHEHRERVIDRYKRGGCPVCTLKARAPRLFETA